MKLPWDQKYLKISFHVIFTSVVVYLLVFLIHGFFYSLTNLSEIFSNAGQSAGKILSVFSPLVTALIIAYLLDPVVGFFQSRFATFRFSALRFAAFSGSKKAGRKPKRPRPDRPFAARTTGTLVTYLLILLFLTLGGYFLVSYFRRTQTADSPLTNDNFIDALSIRISLTVNAFQEAFDRLQINLAYLGLSEYTVGISNFLTALFDQFTELIQHFGRSIVSVASSVASSILSFLLAFVIAFYLLKDKEAILHKTNEAMDVFLPVKINRTIKAILGDINAVFSGYIRGQLTDALIMAILISTWLSIVRVEFAILIGVFSGLSNLIPYFGALIGFAAAVLSALLGGEPMKALYAGLGILLLQQIDGLYIVPKVVGESVELSPLLVIVSLSVGGQLFGITGMVLAVPVCAVFKLFLARCLERKKNLTNSGLK